MSITDVDRSLQYTQDGIPILRKSCLEDYAWCPYKFKSVWLDNKPSEQNLSMAIGTRFHNFAEKFMTFVEVIPCDLWHTAVPDQFIPLEKDMAHWWIDLELTRLERLEYNWELFKPIMLECKISDTHYNIESTIDRVDWISIEDREVEIIEYKTGKKVHWDSLERQLSLYALLYERLTGDTVTHIRLINPRAKVNHRKVLTDAMRWKVIDDINNIREAIKQDDFPRKCTMSKIKWCDICTVDEAFPDIEMIDFTT